MNISIINFSKGPCIYNEDVRRKASENNVEYEITPRMRYSDDSDYIGFQLDIIVMDAEKLVYKTGFLIGLAVNGWSEKLRGGLDLDKNREVIDHICECAWYVASGIVAQQTALSDGMSIILPAIDISKFRKQVILLKQ